MRSISSQAARSIHNIVQAIILLVFIGVAMYALGFNDTPKQPNQKSPENEKTCESQRTWLILPFAFLTGGLMNLEGFASTASLLL
mmetsp:Transcript_123037/g.244900  ORF Transcript_123037/g.244900 Transcript_123037/m.244900 type:complete len:85 (-) Transcript_123037:224-478(-)